MNTIQFPEFNQEQFPTLPKSGCSRIYHSPWGNPIHELTASILLRYCITKGKWQEVPMQTFLEESHKSHCLPFAEQMLLALFEMAREGLVLIGVFQSSQYIIPTPTWAKMVVEESYLTVD